MPAHARVPRRLAFLPFGGSHAVAEGLLTWSMLRGPARRRLLPDVYVHRDGFRAGRPSHVVRGGGAAAAAGRGNRGASAAYLWGAATALR
ncbi:hypothetical protein ACPFP2_08740 [Micromonospora citrea]|uniref:hypothetical protein n=1 Tax=Micromonospora citrea TaxID=47855 RepID=UPI003C354211